jgi:A/G-specific adenine glycosylase
VARRVSRLLKSRSCKLHRVRNQRAPGNSPALFILWYNRGMNVKRFRAVVYGYYVRHKRTMAWRDTRDPYKIVVSEIMLQQTQVARVMEKYPAFIRAFPTLRVLARASLAAVLTVWQGMGYNRRALYLKQLAETVVRDYAGRIPSERALLEKLPGIGPATSASVCAFAFDTAYPFIETNIRSVFIHHFFSDATGTSDAMIIPLVEKTLDRADPRNWYYALMDYGAYLKARYPNPSRKSAAYKRQSPLEGSVRQMRSRVVTYLLAHGPCRRKGIMLLAADKPRIREALAGLIHDRMVVAVNGILSIP